MDFPSIAVPDQSLAQALQAKINAKTKPVGSLGQLEPFALRIGLLQQSLQPALLNPHIVVFAASHGIAHEGVSAYPAEVTYQMVLNFLQGGAAINVFTRQLGLKLLLVDAGVDHEFGENDQLIKAKINYGTKSFLQQAAMSETECLNSMTKGQEIVRKIKEEGCNVIGFGEMGIGNTSSASLLMHKLLNLPLTSCTGRGTGVSDAQYHKKLVILQQALDFHADLPEDSLRVLQTFGGFEIAMMCGAMLRAAAEGMLLLVDGFIASAAFLCAWKIKPAVRHYAVFCHQSAEQGHALLLQELDAMPLLHLNMRLGEGTGCALAYPILQSAVAFLNEMASFESAGVSSKEV